MASDPTTILAEKLRTLEARMARAEDQIQMIDKQTGLGLTLKERQILFSVVLGCILTVVVLRTKLEERIK